jgi:hypothetical protein
LSPQNCVVIFHNFTIDNNLQFINISAEHVNDGVHPTLISGTSDLKLDMLKMTARIIIRIPENEKDKSFQRDLFQTSIDIEKFLKGIGGNWLTRGIMANFRSHLDFEPKVPLPKVRNPIDSNKSFECLSLF